MEVLKNLLIVIKNGGSQMIRVEYIYIKKDNTPVRHFATFWTPKSAVRFMYKCIRSKNLVYTGDFTCDDSEETEEINRLFR